METLRLTKDELLETYDDVEWRSAMFEMARLVDFLKHSILGEKYKVPDELVKVVHLTEHGNRVMQRLITKNEVPPRDARMLCLLKLVHREPLVDLEKTTPESLREVIDRQILDGRLKFPFILGRTLYDRAAELFEDARDLLTHRDTLDLLEGTPVGVFQSGPFVSGPFGLLRSSEHRWFAPTTSVPLYHCNDLTCGAVHRTRLSSDSSASINEHAVTMEKVLDQFGEDESEWSEFIDALEELEGLRFDDQSSEPITLALADLLGDSELRTLLADVLDTTGGKLRDSLSPFGITGRAEEAVELLNRAELIQALLISTNEQLVASLDRLIFAPGQMSESPRFIKVPEGEIRRLQTNQDLSYGTFGIFPEISSFGIRFISRDFQLGPMRLTRLVETLYYMDQHDEVDELQWQLRDIEGDDPREQLEEYVRSVSPDEVVRRLILARRTNQIMACQKLGLEFDRFSDDEQFVAAVLWKLGFYSDDFEDRNKVFWHHHGRLKRYAQTAGVGARVDAEELRSRAVNYFVELEGVLDDSLSFATWALTEDHLAANRPFAFSTSAERRGAFDRLNEFAVSTDGEDEPIDLGEKNTLYPLIQGFGTLSKLLQNARVVPDPFRRPESDYPRYAQYTDLKLFPFLHTMPFLDLLPKSQDRLLETLEHVRLTLEQGAVHQVRNDYTHYRASATDLPRLDASLEAAEKAVSRLETDGLCRLLFGLVGDIGDGWGRRVYTLRNARTREIAFARPSAFDWNRMPGLKGSQYVMPAAVYARPNEMLRFKLVFETDYAHHWQDYPKRRLRRDAVGAKARPAATAIQ
jgi:hypothetical protein